MTRIVLTTLVLLLILLPSTATAQPGAGCLYEGRWNLSYTIVFEYGSLVVPGFARWVEYGSLGFRAVCEGTTVTFSGDGGGNIDVVNNVGPVCSGDYEAQIEGTITDSGANFPVFNVSFIPLTYVNGDCGPGGNRDLTFHTNALIDVNEYEGDLITGFLLAETIPQEEVTRETYIVEAGRRYNPEIEAVSPQYTRYFVRDVPMTNLYTFSMDWDGAPEPAIDLSIQGGEWQAMSVSGDEATYLVSVQSVPLTAADFASAKVINVTMDVRFPFTLRQPFPLSVDQIRMAIVDLPSWASASDFFPETQSDHVIYGVNKYIPQPPLQIPLVEIPSLVPVIGGTWGLEPVQMLVPVRVLSLGTPHSEKIVSAGTLHLGGKSYDIQVEGDIWTTITGNGIEILNSPFTISLEQPIVIQDSISVFSFLPLFGSLADIPIVSDILEPLFSPFSLTLQLTADVSGSGVIGVTPAGELGIIEGTLTLSVDGVVGGGGVIPIAWFALAGTVGGDVVFNLVPEAAITECQLRIGVIVAAGAEGAGSGVEPLVTQIPLCN